VVSTIYIAAASQLSLRAMVPCDTAGSTVYCGPTDAAVDPAIVLCYCEYCRVLPSILRGTLWRTHECSLTVCSLAADGSTAQVYLSPAYVEEQNSWLEIRRWAVQCGIATVGTTVTEAELVD
jgi:hypothetical protein